ncbi:MAG: hypothetical protein IJG55_10340 [Synergistaceae bacterium]|nr:hypothetical protein [Synergistaceae bacterium]
MHSRRVWSCWLLMGLFFFAVISGGCGGGSSSGSGTGNGNGESYTGNNTISYEALEGTWTGSNGSGSGQNNKYLPGQRVPVKVENLEYSIRNINYSEASKTGTAELSLKEHVTNEQYGVNSNRDWGGGFSTFTMTNSGQNSWTFSREYSDGEDNVTITLQSENAGRLRNVGSLINENDPSDRTDFDFTCDVTKQADESPSPDEPGEPVEYVDWTKFSGTWIPEHGAIDVFKAGSDITEFALNYASSGFSLSISESENEGEYDVSFYGDAVIPFVKTNTEGYTCSRNTYDLSGACTFKTSSEYQGLHSNHEENPSGLFISIFDWSDNEINFVFIDEDNAITSAGGELITSEVTVSFRCRRAGS